MDSFRIAAAIEAFQFMTPSGNSLHVFQPLPTHCPVTGMPIHGHTSWRHSSPGGRFRLRVSLIGDRIVWLQPKGYARQEDARRGMALLDDVFYAAQPSGATFIAVDDYSGVRGASLKARRLIMRRLRGERRISAYIVYGAPRVFAAGLTLGRRLGLFPCAMIVAADYEAAMATAQQRLFNLEATALGRARHGGAVSPIGGGRERNVHHKDASRLDASSGDLLAFVGAIALEPYGVVPTSPTVPLGDPYRPVYDALNMLRDDRRDILRRHREARQELASQEQSLTETQGLLKETHTTLKILLASRQDERRRLERRMREGLHTHLQPLKNAFDAGRGDGQAQEWMELLQQVVDHIGAPLACESLPMKAPFTAQERLIAFILATGRDAGDIARLLGLSRRTVENHCQRMRRKLGLQGRRPTLKSWLATPESAVTHPFAVTP